MDSFLSDNFNKLSRIFVDFDAIDINLKWKIWLEPKSPISKGEAQVGLIKGLCKKPPHSLWFLQSCMKHIFFIVVIGVHDVQPRAPISLNHLLCCPGSVHPHSSPISTCRQQTTTQTNILALGDSLTEGLYDWPSNMKFHPYTLRLQQLLTFYSNRWNVRE